MFQYRLPQPFLTYTLGPRHLYPVTPLMKTITYSPFKLPCNSSLNEFVGGRGELAKVIGQMGVPYIYEEGPFPLHAEQPPILRVHRDIAVRTLHVYFCHECPLAMLCQTLSCVPHGYVQQGTVSLMLPPLVPTNPQSDKSTISRHFALSPFGITPK